MLRHVEILGYSILDEPAAHVATAICDDLSPARPKSCVFLNPHSIVVAKEDDPTRRALASATEIFCDGIGLSLAGLLLNRRRVERVYGYEFFMAMSAELSARRISRVFFLGGTEESLARLSEKYRQDFLGISAVGTYAPPHRSEFTSEEIVEMALRIKAFGADVLWVGLGSPKQEKVLHQLMPICEVSCGAAIGAVFDFYTGRIPHAPEWVRRMGLQWAHRLMLEPKRLWRRTLVSTPLFLWLVILDLIGLRRPGNIT